MEVLKGFEGDAEVGGLGALSSTLHPAPAFRVQGVGFSCSSF